MAMVRYESSKLIDTKLYRTYSGKNQIVPYLRKDSSECRIISSKTDLFRFGTELEEMNAKPLFQGYLVFKTKR